MTISEKLAERLYELSSADLKKIKDETRMSSRIGLIIQAFRKAISLADVYLYNGVPYYFNDKIYEPIDTEEFKGVIYDVMTRAKMPPCDYTQVEKVQRIAMQAVKSKPLVLRKDIIVFENCVLMLGDMTPEDELKREKKTSNGHRRKPVRVPHSPALAQISMCHFNYRPTAECPMWNNFLDSVLENMQARMVLQEFLGCIYIDRKQANFSSFLILIGNGSNGKSVVSETVRGIVGEDSMTSYGLDSLLTGNESLHNIAKMNGKRANWCTEIQAIQAGRFSDKLKQLISGEPTECRQLYGLPFTANEIPVMMANCNALPPINDTSYGMERRLVIIRFEKTIPVGKQDKMLLQKLKPEYPGIFNWIMEGRQRFIDQHYNFTECKTITDAVKHYMESSNNVEEFMRIRTYKPQPDDILNEYALHLSARTLYDEYRRWCISESLTPFSTMHFGLAMSNMGFARTRSKDGNTYKVYGERAMMLLNRWNKERLTRQMVENGGIVNGQELKNGRVYDVGDESASAQWHISRPYLSLIRKAGFLNGVWKREKRDMRDEGARKPVWKYVYIYDHMRLGQRLEAHGVYDCNDNGASLSERRRDQVRKATSFNNAMVKMDKPFRKLTGKGSRYPKDSIFVDPDWEYTPDNAELVMQIYKEVLIDRELDKEIKITKFGKMVTKRKKIEQVIVDKLEGKKSSDDGYDKDTGETLEIDIEDEDLKISEE